jgi:hypothetical protein
VELIITNLEIGYDTFSQNSIYDLIFSFFNIKIVAPPVAVDTQLPLRSGSSVLCIGGKSASLSITTTTTTKPFSPKQVGVG